MRVSKGRLWFSLLLSVEQVSSLRDGFQPLPLRPQDQIKGDYFNLCDMSLVFRTNEHFSWFRGFLKILKGFGTHALIRTGDDLYFSRAGRRSPGNSGTKQNIRV